MMSRFLKASEILLAPSIFAKPTSYAEMPSMTLAANFRFPSKVSGLRQSDDKKFVENSFFRIDRIDRD